MVESSDLNNYSLCFGRRRWEDEYYAAYKKYSGLLHLNDANVSEKNIVKASSPEKFVSAVTKAADKLLGKLRLNALNGISININHHFFHIFRTYSHTQSRGT